MKSLNVFLSGSLRMGLFSLLLIACLLSPVDSRAEKGMWIPLLIEKYNIDAMHAAGLHLSAEDIYSINQDCLKDAVVIFGRGCTGELVSKDGLLLTNHHCGERAIQRHSSVENDYLKHGFWAMNRNEELPNEGLTVSFLRYIEDVTDRVNEGISPDLETDEQERLRAINRGHIEQKAAGDGRYRSQVKPFYYGNEYYLFVYEVFTDVRLVAAPPVSVGNFGEDSDNWMWPRHTGDFSVFRIYAGEDNAPAGYAPDNKPYHPRRYLELNAGGIAEGDFTMVLGYPGSTSHYLYSAEVDDMLNRSLPLKIALRTTRLGIMSQYMKQSDKIRIQYSSKYRRVSNAWKKWQGILLGLKRNDALNQKVAGETDFRAWVAADGERQLKYDKVLDRFASLYEKQAGIATALDLSDEALMAVELFQQGKRCQRLMSQGADPAALSKELSAFFKDFHMPIDRDVFAAMMEAIAREMPAGLKPAFLNRVAEKYKGNYVAFAAKSYARTMLSDSVRMHALIALYAKNPELALKKLRKDPMMQYLGAFQEIFQLQVDPLAEELDLALGQAYKTYMAARMEMAGEQMLFPDANFTMRVTYGKVGGYAPKDAVSYDCFTTMDGIMEKAANGTEEYAVPDKLRTLYENKDFGPYARDGKMPVCFTASNHTSGGNSGSPVLDADGRLIGLNFDRNWEGTMSDVFYDPSICRNIVVDIRYVLFLIDRFGGAGYLLEEMDIHWN